MKKFLTRLIRTSLIASFLIAFLVVGEARANTYTDLDCIYDVYGTNGFICGLSGTDTGEGCWLFHDNDIWSGSGWSTCEFDVGPTYGTECAIAAASGATVPLLAVNIREGADEIEAASNPTLISGVWDCDNHTWTLNPLGGDDGGMDSTIISTGLNSLLVSFGLGFGGLTLLTLSFALGIYGVRFIFNLLTSWIKERSAKKRRIDKMTP